MEIKKDTVIKELQEENKKLRRENEELNHTIYNLRVENSSLVLELLQKDKHVDGKTITGT